MKYGVYAQYRDGLQNGYWVEIKEEHTKEWMENRAYEWGTAWRHVLYEVRER